LICAVVDELTPSLEAARQTNVVNWRMLRTKGKPSGSPRSDLQKQKTMSKKTHTREPLKIPLDFKQTVMAALETKSEPRKKKTSKKA
jgi:hypothetical protein